MIEKPLSRLCFAIYLMCNSKKVIHHSSLTVISLFKASLLCVALVSSFYIHFSLVLLVVTSSVFLNVVFICKEMSSDEAKMKEAAEHKGRQINEDEAGSNVVDEHDDSDENGDFASLKESELGTACDDASDSSLSSNEEESISEEDYLIEIRPPAPEKELEAQDHFLSDVNEISGEDNLIEIDITMGSIRTC